MDQWFGWIVAGLAIGAAGGGLLRAARFHIVCCLLVGPPIGLLAGVGWFLGGTTGFLFLASLLLMLLLVVFPCLRTLLEAPVKAPHSRGYAARPVARVTVPPARLRG